MNITLDLSVVIMGAFTAIPSIVTAILTIRGSKERKMFAAKQMIQGMQSEDYISVELRKKPPSNHDRKLLEYDEYRKNGGNSDMVGKMDEYRKWYASLGVSESPKEGGKL